MFYLSKQPYPENIGVLDGISFYDNLVGIAGVDRSSVYCYWDNSPNDTLKPIRYINDANYKLYKDTSGVKNFYRLSTDINEKHSVPDSSLKPNEIIIKQNFETQIDGIHK